MSKTPDIPSPIRNGFAPPSKPTTNSGRRFTTHPNGERLAATFAAPIDIDKKPAGVIAIIIELTRVSNFLSQLTVGKSAGAFILERDGKVVASPDPNANEAVPLKTDHPLFPVAVEAIQNADAPTSPAKASRLIRT